LPGVADSDWDMLTAVLGAPEPDGSATIALYLVDADGIAVLGADVVPPGGTVTAPYYDGATALDWVQGAATGSFGAVLLFGVPTASVTVDIAINSPGGDSTASGIPVSPNTLTFATQVLP